MYEHSVLNIEEIERTSSIIKNDLYFVDQKRFTYPLQFKNLKERVTWKNREIFRTFLSKNRETVQYFGTHLEHLNTV